MARCFALRSDRVAPESPVHALLLDACSEGDVARVRSLLSRGGAESADAANASNVNLWSPLLFAAEGGALEIVVDDGGNGIAGDRVAVHRGCFIRHQRNPPPHADAARSPSGDGAARGSPA